jgi:cellulose 1,4-beta-cellobiosidase
MVHFGWLCVALAVRSISASGFLDAQITAACSKLWAQCGGKSWSGPKCCEAGSVCKVSNEWYSQCIVGSSSLPSPSPIPTPAPVPTPPTLKPVPSTTTALPKPSPSNVACAAAWEQCGGKTFTGPSCCQTGLVCVVTNDYYSQCLSQTSASSTTAVAPLPRPRPAPQPSPAPAPQPSPAPAPQPSPAPAPQPSPAPAPGPKPAPTSQAGNPFVGHPWYVNPSYRESLANSINLSVGVVQATLKEMQNIPSAFWVDVKSKIYKGQGHPDHETVEGILEDAASCSPPSLVVFIVYDLPNRDCFALASNGEICCHYATGQGSSKCAMSTSGPNIGFYQEVPGAGCTDGLTEYKQTYIDPFAAVLKRFTAKVPVVLVIEPDSLPNMVTNSPDQRPSDYRGCHQETKTAYQEGIKYAIDTLSGTGAHLYLDAGHGGWLGWANSNDDQTSRFVSMVSDLGTFTKIRGFATNVANYQPLGTVLCPAPGTCKGGTSNDPCCKDDPCHLEQVYNWAHNELNYIDVLDSKVKAAAPNFSPGFIIDTGRNGRPGARTDCKDWCNPRETGIGRAPTTVTADPRIDAYFWLKTPGESDGCTKTLPDGSTCPRYDPSCASVDSIGSLQSEPRAPEAGRWFHYQIQMLAANADMGDTSAFQKPGSCGSNPINV